MRLSGHFSLSELTKPQHQVSSSKKRFRALVSGRRFGKTYLCIAEIMKLYLKQKKKKDKKKNKKKKTKNKKKK